MPPPTLNLEILPVLDRGDIEFARALFIEYAQSLNFSLCFQQFDEEIATLPGRYEAPSGRLLLAKIDAWPVACAALRAIAPGIGEMKRLYVQPLYRGLGIGRLLAEQIVSEARLTGYTILRLDTTPDMAEARALYEALGFAPTAPYTHNPLPGTIYMELKLA